MADGEQGDEEEEHLTLVNVLPLFTDKSTGSICIGGQSACYGREIKRDMSDRNDMSDIRETERHGYGYGKIERQRGGEWKINEKGKIVRDGWSEISYLIVTYAMP